MADVKTTPAARQALQAPPVDDKGTTEGAMKYLSAEDIVAIHTLIHLYPHFIDKSFYREVQRLQNAPSMGIGHGQVVYPDGTPRTRHTGSNIRILSDGPGRAFTYVYYTLLHQPPGRPLHIGITGTWGYRVERIDGIWHVVERRDGGARLWGDLTAHLNPVPPQGVPGVIPAQR